MKRIFTVWILVLLVSMPFSLSFGRDVSGHESPFCFYTGTDHKRHGRYHSWNTDRIAAGPANCTFCKDEQQQGCGGPPSALQFGGPGSGTAGYGPYGSSTGSPGGTLAGGRYRSRQPQPGEAAREALARLEPVAQNEQPPRKFGSFAAAIAWINRQPNKTVTVAVANPLDPIQREMEREYNRWGVGYAYFNSGRYLSASGGTLFLNYPLYSDFNPRRTQSAILQEEVALRAKELEANILVPATGPASDNLAVIDAEAAIGARGREWGSDTTYLRTKYSFVLAHATADEKFVKTGADLSGLRNAPIPRNEWLRFLQEFFSEYRDIEYQHYVAGALYISLVDLETRQILDVFKGFGTMTSVMAGDRNIPWKPWEGSTETIRFPNAEPLACRMVNAATGTQGACEPDDSVIEPRRGKKK